MTGKKKLEASIIAYAQKNAEKKQITEELDSIKADIREIMGNNGLMSYEVANLKASVNFRVTRTLDPKVIEELLGRPIPQEAWKITESAVLNVKASTKVA